MLTRLRSQIGTAGLIVAIVALIAALGGGAYAATGGSSGSKATASAKGKPGPRGKTGKTGPAGPQGPAGPAGPAGPKGESGAPGAAGTNGTDGEDGLDGEDGEDGENGSPWTVGGTLPAGKTETGAWAIGKYATAVNPINAPISFPIQLADPLDAAHVHYINIQGKEFVFADFSEVDSTVCLGTPEAPTAAPGHLCVYLGYEPAEAPEEVFPVGIVDPSNINPVTAAGASVAGASLLIALAAEAQARGTWAVTAPASTP